MRLKSQFAVPYRNRNRFFHLAAFPSHDRISCNENNVISLLPKGAQGSDTLLHQPSCPIAGHRIADFLTGKEGESVIIQAVLFVKKNNVTTTR